jgi:natural product biosynthesis luciferase-like monooxygenase protein
MDLSLFHLPTYRPGFAPSLNAFYRELTDSVKLADQLGWARVVVSEHHFYYYGGASTNPAVLLTAWARETRHIRLAAGVSLVALRHPLQVAEDYALLDQLSDGRCDLGISRGFVPHEYAAFGVDPAETGARVLEGLEIIETFFQGQPFAFTGRFTQFDKLQPWPTPVQSPIPIWIAASRDPASFERIGKGAYRLLMNQYPLSFEQLCAFHAIFKQAYADGGHDPALRRSSVALMTHLADSEEQAIEEARLALQEHVTAFRHAQSGDVWNTDYQGDNSVLLELCKSGDHHDVCRERTLICSPAQAVERVARYWAEGFDEVMILCRFGNLSHAQTMQTIRRLSAEVWPAVPHGRCD